jgi:hypothetical protein
MSSVDFVDVLSGKKVWIYICLTFYPRLSYWGNVSVAII